MLFKLSAIAMSFLLLSGCGPEMFLFTGDGDDWDFNYSYPESSSAKLSSSETAKEFKALGISIECDNDVACTESLEHGLPALANFYQSFSAYKQRINRINFKIQGAPTMSSRVVYMPPKVTHEQLKDFFIVWGRILELEKVFFEAFSCFRCLFYFSKYESDI